jgi:hypothetical protein
LPAQSLGGAHRGRVACTYSYGRVCVRAYTLLQNEFHLWYLSRTLCRWGGKKTICEARVLMFKSRGPQKSGLKAGIFSPGFADSHPGCYNVTKEDFCTSDTWASASVPYFIKIDKNHFYLTINIGTSLSVKNKVTNFPVKMVIIGWYTF